MANKKLIEIVYLSSPTKEELITDSSFDLFNENFRYILRKSDTHKTWKHLAGTAEQRLQVLLSAIHNPESKFIWCARGGYGASDLLDTIPWPDLENLPRKTLIGFSDVSALHSAFFTKLNWPCLHAPMPDSALWLKNPQLDLTYVEKYLSEKIVQVEIPLVSLSREQISGWMFGGCLSVLTNLLGTPYFPSSLNGSIVFFEDIDEPYGRIFRNLNQWIQSGSLQGIKAIVLGNFLLDGESQLSSEFVEEVKRRTQIPVFASKDFGHCSPNLPIKIGSSALISGQSLTWKKEILDELS